MRQVGTVVRVPILPEFSWPGAMIVAKEAEDRGLVLVRIWESVDYAVVGGPRNEMLALGTLRCCREWIAGYLGHLGQYVPRPLPEVDGRGDGPPY